MVANSSKACENKDSLGTWRLVSQPQIRRKGRSSGQPIEQPACRRQVVDGLGDKRAGYGRAILARSAGHADASGNVVLDPDDLQGLHELLLFLREWSQLFLQPWKECGLNGQPVWCEALSETYSFSS